MALLGSRQIYKHTDSSPFTELPNVNDTYQVATNGLWRDPQWKFDNDRGPGLAQQFSIEPIQYEGLTTDRIREVLESLSQTGIQIVDSEPQERRMVLHTGPAGRDQFYQAVQDQLVTMIDDTRVQLGTSEQSVIPANYRVGIDPISPGEAFIGYSHVEPGFTNFDRNIPGTLVMPEDIMNSDSITITRQFNTEEEAINYLDQISRDDI